jgi:hypothetical protein
LFGKKDKIAGIKVMESKKAKKVPTAANIPKSFIISKYEPKINEIKPKTVVSEDKKTGKNKYAND